MQELDSTSVTIVTCFNKITKWFPFLQSNKKGLSIKLHQTRGGGSKLPIE